MALVDDNKFPKLIITEGTAPSSPSSGDQKVYIDSSSHHLSRKNSAGTVVDLETNQSSSGAPTAHGCRVKRASTGFSVGNNTLTAVQFDAEDYDTDTMHDTSSNTTRIVIPSISGVTTGLWSVKASGYVDSVVSGRVDVVLRVNAAANPASGTPIGFGSSLANSTGVNGYMVTVDYVFTAADYIECFVRATAGSSSAVFDAGVSPLFEVAFLGKVT